jgi:hypothetical protein
MTLHRRHLPLALCLTGAILPAPAQVRITPQGKDLGSGASCTFEARLIRLAGLKRSAEGDAKADGGSARRRTWGIGRAALPGPASPSSSAPG